MGAWADRTLDYDRIRNLEAESFKDGNGNDYPSSHVLTTPRVNVAKDTFRQEFMKMAATHVIAYGGETAFFDAVAGDALLTPQVDRMLAMAFLHHWFSGYMSVGNVDHEKSKHYLDQLVDAMEAFAVTATGRIRPAEGATIRRSSSVVITGGTSWGKL